MTLPDGDGRVADPATAPTRHARENPPTPDPHTPEGRAAIAELFLREYHRLGGAAARASATDAWAAQVLRRRAIAWRTTAARVRGVAESRWPAWLLSHLAMCEALPIIGADYTRQRVYLERITRRAPENVGGARRMTAPCVQGRAMDGDG